MAAFGESDGQGFQSEILDPQALVGLKATVVSKIVDDDDGLAALQIGFADGRFAVFTVWTDWALRLGWQVGGEIPDYLWPSDCYRRTLLVLNIPECGLEIVSVAVDVDDLGGWIGVRVEFTVGRILLSSVGGELALVMDGMRA